MVQAPNAPHRDFIASQTLADVAQSPEFPLPAPTRVAATSTLEDALQALEAADARVALVHDEDGSVLGLLSTVDVMMYLGTLRTRLEQASLTQHAIEAYGELLAIPAKSLLGLSRHSRELHLLYESDPLDNLIDILCSGVSWVVLRKDAARGSELKVDEDLKVLGQTEAIRFLFANNDRLGDILDNPASSLSFALSRVSPLTSPSVSPSTSPVAGNGFAGMANNARARVLAARANEETLTVFERMARRGFTSVPVTDDQGQIYSVLSATTLRGLTRKNLGSLLSSVVGFLTAVLKGVPAPHTAQSRFTLSMVIANIIRHKAHRVILVTRDMEPAGVVAITDILAALRGNEVELEV